MTPLIDQGGDVLKAALVDQVLDFVQRNTPVTAVLKDSARPQRSDPLETSLKINRAGQRRDDPVKAHPSCSTPHKTPQGMHSV